MTTEAEQMRAEAGDINDEAMLRVYRLPIMQLMLSHHPSRCAALATPGHATALVGWRLVEVRTTWDGDTAVAKHEKGLAHPLHSPDCPPIDGRGQGGRGRREDSIGFTDAKADQL